LLLIDRTVLETYQELQNSLGKRQNSSNYNFENGVPTSQRLIHFLIVCQLQSLLSICSANCHSNK